MLSKRALAKKLLKIVFSTEDTITYMRKHISFEKEAIKFVCVPSLALRKTTVYFRARGLNPKDLYCIIIEGSGSGENLKSHLNFNLPAPGYAVDSLRKSTESDDVGLASDHSAEISASCSVHPWKVLRPRRRAGGGGDAHAPTAPSLQQRLMPRIPENPARSHH